MADDPARWTVHGTRRVYSSQWVNVDLDDVEIPGGPRFDHHVLRFPRASVGAVVVEEGQVLLLWRHRFATDTWGWEIPAGWSDDGEDPADAIAREIREETGYRAATITPLVTYSPMSGISDQWYRVFVATDVHREGKPDAAEASRIKWMPLGEVRALIASDRISDGPSLTALSTYLTLT